MQASDGLAREIDGVLHGADHAVADFIYQLTGCGPVGPYTSHALLDAEGRMIFGCLWYNYRCPDDVEVAMAATDVRPAMPQVFRHILNYPFGILGVKHISAEIAKDNERVIRFARGIGMRLEGEKRGIGRLMFGLLKEDCPFLKAKNDGRHAVTSETDRP